MYKPTPKNTDNIQLSDALLQLTELIAENVHDTWAQMRISEGWTYGPKRDDSVKRHPDLIPYKDLADSEKEYDRRTAMETLKLIISLGYRIEKA